MSETVSQEPVETKAPPLSEEEVAAAQKILEYAKAQESFAWVYRAEGVQDSKYNNSAGGDAWRGTWFTPSWENAQRYVTERSHIPEMKVYALVIPTHLLDERDHTDTSMLQVNILSPYLLESKRVVDAPQTTIPTVLDYCSQIKLLQKYAAHKNVSVEELLEEMV